MYNTEFHELLANKALQPNLQTWLGDQEVTNSTAYVGRLPPKGKAALMKKYRGLQFKGKNSYTMKVTSGFISACNTASVDVNTFDSSTYDRVGILTLPDSELDEELAAQVDILSRNPPPEGLVDAWRWMSGISIKGMLHEVPLDWKREMAGLPRMRTRQNAMTRGYSVAFLPMKYGYLATEEKPYQMRLSKRAFELSQVYIEDFKIGQRRMNRNLYSGDFTGVRARKNKEYGEYVECEVKRGTLTCRGFAEKFKVSTEAARVQFRKRGLIPRGRRWYQE